MKTPILSTLLVLLSVATACALEVTNTTDAGAGSLRQAIIDAPSGDTITFANTLAGQTIVLTSGQVLINKNLDIDASDLTGGIIIDGNANGRIFEIADLIITNVFDSLTLTNGIYLNFTSGGAIYVGNNGTLTLNNSTLSGNSAHGGGGIFNRGTLTLNNSTLSDSSANGINGTGGGILNTGTLTLNNSTLSGNSAAIGGNRAGGGIANSGTVTLNNSTLSGNSAVSGGGIINWGTLTLNNSTLSGNSAESSGGGINNRGTGTLILSNSTLSDNSANGFDGGGIGNSGGTINATNSIVAGNFGNNGVVVDGSNNLIINGDPMLNPLGDYGGPTQTMPPLPGSAAIDAGLTSATNSLTDQRGLARVVGSAVDIGAVEIQPIEQVHFDFENGTAEGWTTVLSDPNVPHVFTVTNALTNNGETLPTPARGNYQVLPIDFDDPNSTANTRDGAHATLLMRSPEFVLAGGQLSIAMVGGAEAGTLPTTPSALASATNAADGIHVKGFGLRRVSDGTYVATGSLSANTNSYQDVALTAATLAPFVSETETYTLDVFDSFGGSWGWIGFDNVRIPGALVGGPYSQDFESFADGATNFSDGSTLITTRSAAVGVIDHALQLTSDTITGTRTSFLMPPISHLSSGFRACFDYKLIDAPNETINDLPADGFSFNIGAIPPSASGDEEGFGIGLSIEFDTHLGLGSDIIGHNVAVNGTDVPGGSNATEPQVDGQWHSVCIEWADGKVTVSVDEIALFTDLATPGFTPIASNIFAFATRTGGATETLLIDNISITPPKPVVLIALGLTGDTLTLAIENIPSGQTFHLRQSTDLTNFQPLSPPVDITDTTPQPMALTVDPTAQSPLFFTVYAGASPAP